MSNKRLIIVDISSFIFRAFHAIRILNAPDGTPVNAVSGVLSMLLKLLTTYSPSHIVLARDMRGGSFRNEMYDLYKANRSEPPEELIPQFSLIEQLVNKLKLPNVQIKNYEADDIIGSMAVQWKDDFNEILVASGDKDLMQFIDDKIKMLDTQRDIVYGPIEVFDKMGVRPDQIVDYLSMLGDASDNIPGMKGIGAKGAAKLLAEFETLDNCIENKDLHKGKKLTNAFENHIEDAYLSRSLIKIVTDLDLGLKSEDTAFKFEVSDELIEFLKSLGFKAQVTRLVKLAELEKNIEAHDAESDAPFMEQSEVVTQFDCKSEITTNENVDGLINALKSSSEAAFYLEQDSDIISIIVSLNEESSFIVPISMNPMSGVTNITTENLDLISKASFERDDFQVITNDGKALYKNHLIKAHVYDVTQADFVLYPDRKHDFLNVVKSNLDFELPVWDKKKAVSDFLESELVEYLGIRGAALLKSYCSIKNELKDESDLNVLNEIDFPSLNVLAHMEKNGIKLNVPFFKKFELELAKEIQTIEDSINDEAGSTVNLRSPKQVGELLFTHLGLPVIKKTKTGFSTNSDVLHELSVTTDSKVPEMILKFRELDKLQSTYVKALPQLVSERTGRVHTTFNANIAATGRLSSTNPNLQNIPVRSEMGKKVRKGFVTECGKILLTADYSQVELRLLAHFSKDPIMVDSFLNDEDIHAQTAAEIMEIPLSDVTDDDRRKAKAVNFGLMYGQSSFGLSQALGISRGEAKDYITRYFERFSQVKSYLDSLKEKCELEGYTQTMHGRRRFLPNIQATNRNIKAMAEREAINTPIQGTASDIIKLAMINIFEKMNKLNMKSKMLLQVHDELIFEADVSELEELQKLVKSEMENVVDLSVPLKVDMGIGVNWYDLK